MPSGFLERSIATMHKHANNRDDDGYYVLLGLICAVLITTAAILFSIGFKMLA